ncbi:MAG TPA: hypothetical protein RMH99_14585, partial [Sandaracinaceae bacterium LLY-WYZ-13_1]|nr:hypothetical protein [Sandaracinaceae bacterium LLY-WYZ-13_1]
MDYTLQGGSSCLTLLVSMPDEPGKPSKSIVAPADSQSVDFYLGQAKSYAFSHVSDRFDEVLSCEGLQNPSLDQGGIARVATKAGLHPRDAALLRDARESANLTSLPASLFFALGRAGLSARVSELVKIPAKQRSAALSTAIKSGVLSDSDAQDAQNQLSGLDSIAIESALKPGTSIATPAVAMDMAGIQQGRDTILTAWRDHTGDTPDFWNSLQLDPTQKANLQFALQLQTLTRMHVPLMQELFAEHSAFTDLVALDADGWIAKVQGN